MFKSGLQILKFAFVFLFVAGCSSNSNTPQPKKSNFSKVKNPQHFFKKADLMQFGVYYYPEQWTQNQWERDLKNIKKLGFTFTHFGEFAWGFLEPEEGKFDFKWLDKAIDIASKAGLKIILCTPTPCPPVWMAKKYPDIYLVDERGRRRVFGDRADISVTSKRYNAFVKKIVTELGKRYGRNKNIIGWQIDNEPNAFPDYSPSAQKAFQKWLKEKYGTIDSLNAVWDGAFWSTMYQRFDQIEIPNTSVYTEDKLSPQAVLDFKRFTADAQAQFLNRQAEILRKYIDPRQWITTNYCNVTYDADPRLSDKLDFITYTMYPVSGRNPLGGQSFRMGSPYRIEEANDYFRSIDGVTGVMELQPGQVNWAPINPQLFPGVVHMWLMHAFSGGCSFACTYRYRHPLSGSEMYHDGIVGTDGVTLSSGGKQFVKAIREMDTLRQLYNSTATMPHEIAARKTAFLWNQENLWDLEIQKQTSYWNTWRLRNIYTAAVKSTGAPMDFVTEKDDFSPYPFMVAPAYQLINKALVEKWTRYVKKGGNLILSCRTGVKNKNGHFFEAKWAAPITSLIGAQVDFFDMLVPGVTGKIVSGKKMFSWHTWADILSPKKGTEVLATYANQFYKGKAAVVTRKLGKGTVTYIGAESNNGELERQIIRLIYQRAGVKIEDLPPGVFVNWRDGFYVGVNYTNHAVKLSIPKESKIIFGKNPLKPANAVIWK